MQGKCKTFSCSPLLGAPLIVLAAVLTFNLIPIGDGFDSEQSVSAGFKEATETLIG